MIIEHKHGAYLRRGENHVPAFRPSPKKPGHWEQKNGQFVRVGA